MGFRFLSVAKSEIKKFASRLQPPIETPRPSRRTTQPCGPKPRLNKSQPRFLELKSEPFKAEPFEVEPFEVEPFQVEPFQVESFEVEPFEVEPFEIEPYEVEPFAAEPFELEPQSNQSGPQLIDLESHPGELEPQPQPEEPNPRPVEFATRPVECEAHPVAIPSPPVESISQQVGLQSLPNELILQIYKWADMTNINACGSFPILIDCEGSNEDYENHHLLTSRFSWLRGTREPCDCDPLSRAPACMWRVLAHPLLFVDRRLRWLGLDYICWNATFEIGPFLYEDCAAIRKGFETGDGSCHKRVRRLNLHIMVTDLFLSNAMGTNTIWRLLFNEMRERFIRPDATIKVVMWFCARRWRNEFDFIVLMIKDIAAYMDWPNLYVESRDLPAEDQPGIKRRLKADYRGLEYFYDDPQG